MTSSRLSFLPDTLSVQEAYQNHKLPNLAKALQQVAATRRAVLQRIPAHCGISGNEQADILQKRIPEENSITTRFALAKRRLSSERSRCQDHRGMIITCYPGSSIESDIKKLKSYSP